jgi:hypothetical protein
MVLVWHPPGGRAARFISEASSAMAVAPATGLRGPWSVHRLGAVPSVQGRAAAPSVGSSWVSLASSEDRMPPRSPRSSPRTSVVPSSPSASSGARRACPCGPRGPGCPPPPVPAGPGCRRTGPRPDPSRLACRRSAGGWCRRRGRCRGPRARAPRGPACWLRSAGGSDRPGQRRACTRRAPSRPASGTAVAEDVAPREAGAADADGHAGAGGLDDPAAPDVHRDVSDVLGTRAAVEDEIAGLEVGS